MDARGNCAWFGGSPGTGKSYEALEYAKSREKSIIIYDWTTNNVTYKQKIVPLDYLDLTLRPNEIVRIQDSEENFLEFVSKCHKISNATIVMDDCTSLFEGKIPKYFKQLLYKRKNQNLDFCLQFHTISDTPPAFLKACNLFFIKATSDSMPLKGTAPHRKHIEMLIEECYTENANYKSAEKWATRLFDITDETIAVKDVKNPDFWASYKGKKTIYNYIKSKNNFK